MQHTETCGTWSTFWYIYLRGLYQHTLLFMNMSHQNIVSVYLLLSYECSLTVLLFCYAVLEDPGTWRGPRGQFQEV